MSNLIITIISIALLAITALLGAYYGGTAFTNYQAKAQALTIENTLQQIVAAMHLWEGQNGQDFMAANGPNGILQNSINSIIIPTYMQKYPLDAANHIIPSTISSPYEAILMVLSFNSVNNGTYFTLNDRPYFLDLGTNTSDLSLDSEVENWKRICKGAAQIGRGSGAAPLASFSDRAQAGQFDCEITYGAPSNNIDNCSTAVNCNINLLYRM